MSKLIMASSFTPFTKGEISKAFMLLPELSGKKLVSVGCLCYGDEVHPEYMSDVLLLDYWLRLRKIGTASLVLAGDNLTGFDAIMIPGGNTFEILTYLKWKGVFDQLKECAQMGKVLIGKSAGSIIMTPTIRIAQFADDNEFNLDDLQGLSLVDFEVKPHWNDWAKRYQVFVDYSKYHKTRVFGIPERSAIVVDTDSSPKLRFFGHIEVINGQ